MIHARFSLPKAQFNIQRRDLLLNTSHKGKAKQKIGFRRKCQNPNSFHRLNSRMPNLTSSRFALGLPAFSLYPPPLTSLVDAFQPPNYRQNWSCNPAAFLFPWLQPIRSSFWA
jgi:hypothetical protein